MTTADMNPDDPEERLIARVALALEKRAAGEHLDLDQLCDGDPVLRAEVEAALALALAPALAEGTREVYRTDPMEGRLLCNRYRLRTRLGQGAMGVVYEADDEVLHRVVAVKLFPAVRTADPLASARFLREAELLAAFNHPRVVTIHDRGCAEDGTLFLVTERLRGGSFADLLTGQDVPPTGDPALWPWPEGMVTSALPAHGWLRLHCILVMMAAEGLAAAHAAGIVHRDVKPSNLWLCEDFTVVLLDFGIASRDDDATLTAADSTLGTPYYMAPEQARSGQRPGPAADVYGLTATLYHLLTGQPPLAGDPREVLLRVQTEDPVPAARLRPDLPADLRAILDHGLERDPKRRYANAALLLEDLRAFLEHRPVSVRPLSSAGRMWRRVRARPARAVAVGMTLSVLLLLVIAVPLVQERNQRLRAEATAALEARLPLLLTLESTPSERLRIPEAELREQRQQLDRLLSVAPDHSMALWLRSGLHLDLGEHERAASDLRTLLQLDKAARSDGHLAVTLQRFLAADRSVRGIQSVDLQDLPTPETAHEQALFGYHTLRRRDSGFEARAESLLRAAAERLPAARPLHALALLTHAATLGRTEAAAGMLDEALHFALTLEQQHGKQARLLALQGAIKLLKGRHDEAVVLLEQSDQLAPMQAGTLVNLGIAYRRQNRLEDARRVLLEAAQLRPWNTNTVRTLVAVEKDAGDLEQAIARATALPGDAADAIAREDLLGTLHLRQALLAEEAGDREGFEAAARSAFDHFDAAVAAGGRGSVATRRTLAHALLAGEATTASAAMLAWMGQEPENPYQIANLATLLPEDGLDGLATHRLRLYLRRLAIVLGSGDAGFQQRQERRLLEERQQRPR